MSSSLLASAAGHARTVWAEIGWCNAAEPPSVPFTATLHDPVMGEVRLAGRFGDAPSSTLVVIVPGLTGTAAARYCIPAAWAAQRAGFAHLRIGMRGTDRTGEDIWHGGLTDDLRAACASPRLARFTRILLLGYSVGGHVALRAAIERVDPRICAVAAVCPPLDLELGTQIFDEPAQRIYRDCILAALDEIYAATAARKPLPVPLAEVRRARSSRERDALAIAPRFGFTSAEDYYWHASVAPILPRLAMPALCVAALHDPIVPPRAIAPSLAAARRTITTRWFPGGHLAFPRLSISGSATAPESLLRS